MSSSVPGIHETFAGFGINLSDFIFTQIPIEDTDNDNRDIEASSILPHKNVVLMPKGPDGSLLCDTSHGVGKVEVKAGLVINSILVCFGFSQSRVSVLEKWLFLQTHNVGLCQMFSTASYDFHIPRLTQNTVLISRKFQKQLTRRDRGPLKDVA